VSFLTIRNWFDKHWVSPKPRTGVQAGKSDVLTPEPPQTPQPPQPDDLPVNSEAGASNGCPDSTGVQSILIAVQKTSDDVRCVADLTDDIPNAQGMVAAWVEAGVPPDAVSVWRVAALPLNISYEWSVEIRDHVKRGPERRSPQRPAHRADHPPASRGEPQAGATGAGKPIGVLSRANDLMQDIMPEAPFQLRFDRVVWLGLWAASLLVLGILLVASLSGGSAREFVIGGQPSPLENESVGSNVTARPTVAPSASPGASAAAAPLPSCLQGSVNNCQCQDFTSQGEAQKLFTTYPPPNRQPVDPDADGLVCEWLPKITASPRQ
jgi:hypothetical protein